MEIDLQGGEKTVIITSAYTETLFSLKLPRMSVAASHEANERIDYL